MLENLSCRPGSYVEIVPLGLLCTLQYNANGILQKIFCGFDPVNHTDADEFDAQLTLTLKSQKIIPQRIPFTQGSTFVKGVFYTQKLFKSEGLLPDCVKGDILADINKNSEDYRFYAADLWNDSYNFVGGAIIATRLSTFGFEPLPGYQVFDDVQVLPIEDTMRQKKSPFVFPYISGIMIHENCKQARYVPAGLEQFTVLKVNEYIEDHGYLRGQLTLRQGTLDVPYSQMVKYNIQDKSTVVANGDNVVAARKAPGLINAAVSRDRSCTICGHKMIVPHDGPSYCSDSNCPSRMYLAVKHFLQVLGLPEIKFADYMGKVRNKDITCLIDVLSLPEYKNTKIECTLSNLLFAACPIEICRSVDFFQKFTHYLGSVEALDFYLENPDAVVTDLQLNKMYSRNYASWLKDPHNVIQIRALLNMPEQITIKSVSKKFEGAPIFRDKTICLTGQFRHGTIEDVIAILQSYSARVVTAFDNTVNCVVLGHFENEDKAITDLATSYNVPIYGEDDFFKSYEIDLDIRKQRDVLTGYLK